jgi:hypothetical protein
MDINGKQLTAVSLEQLRALSERIKEAKAGAIGNMKEAAEAMHEQGRLLIQAEMELGDAFDTFVDSLANEGIDPNQARYNIKLAKKHKEVRSLFTDPSAAKQLVLQNFAPPTPPKPETAGDKVTLPFSLSFHLNIDPMDWNEEIKRDFLAKAKPVVQLVEEIKW